MTPVSLVFPIIWTTIYAWQAVWLLYGLTTICRRMRNTGSYLYVYPPLIPKLTYIFFILNNVVVTVWIFLWDREYLEYALIALALSVAALYLAIFFTARQTLNYGVEFVNNGQAYELCLVRTLAHNGMSFFATWISIATLLNLGTVLAYRVNLDQVLASTIVLLILAGELVFWFIADLFLIEKATRYIFTPYIVVIVAALGGVLKGNFDATNANSLLTAVILGAACLMFVIKIAAVCVRRKRKPLYSGPQYIDPLAVRYGTFEK